MAISQMKLMKNGLEIVEETGKYWNRFAQYPTPNIIRMSSFCLSEFKQWTYLATKPWKM